MTRETLFRLAFALFGVFAVSRARSETSLRLFSVSYGLSQADFSANNGADQYTLSQYTLAADVLALDYRFENFPYAGMGTSIFARYEDTQLQSSLTINKGQSGSLTLQTANYNFSAVAPALWVDFFPFPGLRPIEPFIEAKCEVYEFAETTVTDPSVDRYRPLLEIGVKGQPNDTGYFWGARIYAAKRGYGGTMDGVAIPDPIVVGLQVDWIGLLLQ